MLDVIVSKRGLDQALSLAEDIHWAQLRLKGMRQSALFAGMAAVGWVTAGLLVALIGWVNNYSALLLTSPAFLVLGVHLAMHHWSRMQHIKSRLRLEGCLMPKVLSLVEGLRRSVPLTHIQQATVDIRCQRLGLVQL